MRNVRSFQFLAVRDSETLEEALSLWRSFVTESLKENVAGAVASLSPVDRMDLLDGMAPSDAEESFQNSSLYLQDVSRMLDQLGAGDFQVYAIGVERGGSDAELLTEILRAGGAAVFPAETLSTLPLLPPTDPARDRAFAIGDPSEPELAPQLPVQGLFGGTYSYEEHLSRYGVMTWTPWYADPDFFYLSSEGVNVLESDIKFGSSFRVSGHDVGYCDPQKCVYSSYEWEFELTADWAHGYATYFVCDLPAPCTTDVMIGDPNPYRNYAAVSGNASAIAANSEYHIDIGVQPGSDGSSEVQLRSIVGATSTECPFKSGGIEMPDLCSFENYSHWYDKLDDHHVPGYYLLYYGGSYITDNTFSPCPGNWGFSSGNVDFWCWTSTNGPEPPGRVTIRPKAGYSSGYAYRTVTFTIEPGDHFSVEYVVQCLTGNPCNGRLGWEGRGQTQVEVHYGQTFTIPNDGWYYLCRFDSEHGAGAPAILANSQIRARLYNMDGGDQLRIDAMAIYGYVGYHDGWFTSTDSATCNRVAQG